MNAQRQTLSSTKNSALHPAPGVGLQRKCACGNQTIAGGECDACKKKKNGLQRKLAIGASNDPLEQEADRVADQVMSNSTATGTTSVLPHIQRFSGQSSENVGEAPGSVDRVLSGSGRPLEPTLRHDMETRFGYDFSKVRVHTGSEAEQSARDINALAYTVGNDVVFGNRQFMPQSTVGKRLIAHELAHVIGQGGVRSHGAIHRCPDAVSLAEYNRRVTSIRALPEYGTNYRANRRVIEDIITTARGRDDCLNMAERLEALFTTPVDQSPAVGAAVSATMASAAQIERERLATPEGARLQGLQESMASAATRNWETLSPPPRGWGHMATFRIDRSDPNNIIVQVNIRVRGNRTDVANIVAQEDGIERAAQELGYTLDVQFVTRNGPDVFTVTVDPRLPQDAGNWSTYDTDPSGYTHEIHHLLGLDDRYDYTGHAYNERMDIPNRLHWFQIEVHRPPDPLRMQSLMGSGSHLLDDDICRVSQLDFSACMSARQARRDMITRARGAAFSKAFRVFEILSAIRPVAPVYGAADMRDLQVRRMVSMAQNIFGTSIDQDSLAENIGDMRHRLLPGIDVQPMPSADSNCTGNAHYVVDMRPPIRLCPQFFGLAADDQEKTFLRASAQLVRLDNSLPVSLCASSDCNVQCGGFNNADTWAKFIKCATSVR